MVDTGADYTDFPGWYDRSEKKIYDISGDAFDCNPAFIVNGQTYYGALITWCKIGTTAFTNLGTNTGVIYVMIT